MALAILPLVARAVSVSYYNHLSGPGATPADKELAQKLLIPGRLMYALLYDLPISTGVSLSR
jgi:hypothetical protein